MAKLMPQLHTCTVFAQEGPDPDGKYLRDKYTDRMERHWPHAHVAAATWSMGLIPGPVQNIAQYFHDQAERGLDASQVTPHLSKPWDVTDYKPEAGDVLAIGVAGGSHVQLVMLTVDECWRPLGALARPSLAYNLHVDELVRSRAAEKMTTQCRYCGRGPAPASVSVPVIEPGDLEAHLLQMAPARAAQAAAAASKQ